MHLQALKIIHKALAVDMPSFTAVSSRALFAFDFAIGE
jgi:hypothetical protein